MPLPKEHLFTAKDYWALPDGVRTELIDGQLWNLASPSRKHQEIQYVLSRKLGDYIDSRNGMCKVYTAPFAVNLFGNESAFVEPDLCVVCDRSKLSDRGCEGAPDLVVEVVSPGNPGMDYVTKLNLYMEAGVREYWICDPMRERTFVYRFDDQAVPAVYPFNMPVRSEIFPAFEANIGDIVANM